MKIVIQLRKRECLRTKDKAFTYDYPFLMHLLGEIVGDQAIDEVTVIRQ